MQFREGGDVVASSNSCTDGAWRGLIFSTILFPKNPLKIANRKSPIHETLRWRSMAAEREKWRQQGYLEDDDGDGDDDGDDGDDGDDRCPAF